MGKGFVISWFLLCGGLLGLLMYMGTRESVAYGRRFND